ncbi:MAG: hypothetical protein RMK98_08140 [Bacteroidia bacterium]|nr:hypothetical protein [Bacteroidia bacterium]
MLSSLLRRAERLLLPLFLSSSFAQKVALDTLIPPGVDSLPLPAGWLLPNRVRIEPAIPFTYDTAAHVLRWRKSPDTLRVRASLYRLPRAAPRYQTLPWSALQSWDSFVPPPAYVPFSFTTQEDTFTPRIRRTGTFLRTITVGTGQNATLNGAFRLNLEGEIAPDLFLLAALTDENLPFQTATQTLSDFDRVNIGLRWKQHQLLLGDIELKERRSRFANFYRNVLGIQARLSWKSHWTHLAFAEAKGRFHTNSFMGQEGRQGPYTLTGKNGERFILILAGSEKVYVNGVLMQRGQDRDYTMDYTTGEITFTPRVPITAATRIVVDFEYAERSYGRSFIWLEESGHLPKGTWTASYFRQADNPRRPLDFSLTPEQESYLASLPAGTSVGILSGVDTLPFQPGSIRYESRDTILNGTPIRYFVLSQDPQRAQYQVSFVFVGAGRGDYIREPSFLNANTFRWVGPGRGDFRVGRAVPLPNSVEVLSLRHKYSLLSHLHWESEVDISRYTGNRFAGRYVSDIAVAQGLTWQAMADSAPLQFHPQLLLQYVGAHYQSADRVYEREYGRLWNFNDLASRQVERLAELRLPLLWRKRYSLTPQAGWRSWGDSLQTQRYALLWEGRDTTRGLGGSYLGEYIPSQARLGHDRWLRHTGRIFYTYGRWRIGTHLWIERRKRTLADTATFRFYEITPFLEYKWKQLFVRLSYQRRREWQLIPELGKEGLRFHSHMPQLNLSWEATHWRATSNISYRVFVPGDTAFRLEAGRYLLTQSTLKISLSPWDIDLFHQLSSEQTPQRQIVFVAVNPGEGTHEWHDLNADGLQQLEEFVPAVNPLLAKYVRIQRATGIFLRTLALSTALSLRWQPKHYRWIGYRLNTRLDQRRRPPNDRWLYFLPTFPSQDTSLFLWNLSHRQDLFLFRSATRGDQTFSFQYQLSQSTPLSGWQKQSTQTYTSRTRYNFSSQTGIELTLSLLQRRSIAPLQLSLNYTYQGWEAAPQSIWQPSGRWRLTAGIVYRHRTLLTPARIPLYHIRLPLEARWSWRAGALANIRIEPLWIALRQSLPPLLAFELLEGFRPGRNAFLGLTLSLPLSRFLELSALYEGRFSQEIPNHSARMQIRANF